MSMWMRFASVCALLLNRKPLKLKLWNLYECTVRLSWLLPNQVDSSALKGIIIIWAWLKVCMHFWPTRLHFEPVELLFHVAKENISSLWAVQSVKFFSAFWAYFLNSDGFLSVDLVIWLVNTHIGRNPVKRLLTEVIPSPSYNHE